MQWLHEGPPKDLFSHDTMSWMDLDHQLDARTRGPVSGCPAVVVMQPTHDRTSDHLVACILSGRNRSAQFRDPLPNPLMRSCLVEVGDIAIEHALELFLLQDQQVVQAFLSHTSQEALADSIGSGSVSQPRGSPSVTSVLR
jgi:hypothetical protein